MFGLVDGEFDQRRDRSGDGGRLLRAAAAHDAQSVVPATLAQQSDDLPIHIPIAGDRFLHRVELGFVAQKPRARDPERRHRPLLRRVQRRFVTIQARRVAGEQRGQCIPLQGADLITRFQQRLRHGERVLIQRTGQIAHRLHADDAQYADERTVSASTTANPIPRRKPIRRPIQLMTVSDQSVTNRMLTGMLKQRLTSAPVTRPSAPSPAAPITAGSARNPCRRRTGCARRSSATRIRRMPRSRPPTAASTAGLCRSSSRKNVSCAARCGARPGYDVLAISASSSAKCPRIHLSSESSMSSAPAVPSPSTIRANQALSWSMTTR